MCETRSKILQGGIGRFQTFFHREAGRKFKRWVQWGMQPLARDALAMFACPNDYFGQVFGHIAVQQFLARPVQFPVDVIDTGPAFRAFALFIDAAGIVQRDLCRADAGRGHFVDFKRGMRRERPSCCNIDF